MHLGLTKSSSVNKWQELVTVCSEIWIFHSLNLHSPRVIGTSIRTIHFLCICTFIMSANIMTKATSDFPWIYTCASYAVLQLEIRRKKYFQLQFPTSCTGFIAYVGCSGEPSWTTNTSPFLQHDSEAQTKVSGSAEKLHCRQCMTCKDCIHSGCPQQYWEHTVHRK